MCTYLFAQTQHELHAKKTRQPWSSAFHPPGVAHLTSQIPNTLSFLLPKPAMPLMMSFSRHSLRTTGLPHYLMRFTQESRFRERKVLGPVALTQQAARALAHTLVQPTEPSALGPLKPFHHSRPDPSRALMTERLQIPTNSQPDWYFSLQNNKGYLVLVLAVSYPLIAPENPLFCASLSVHETCFLG